MSIMHEAYNYIYAPHKTQMKCFSTADPMESERFFIFFSGHNLPQTRFIGAEEEQHCSAHIHICVRQILSYRLFSQTINWKQSQPMINGVNYMYIYTSDTHTHADYVHCNAVRIFFIAISTRLYVVHWDRFHSLIHFHCKSSFDDFLTLPLRQFSCVFVSLTVEH